MDETSNLRENEFRMRRIGMEFQENESLVPNNKRKSVFRRSIGCWKTNQDSIKQIVDIMKLVFTIVAILLAAIFLPLIQEKEKVLQGRMMELEQVIIAIMGNKTVYDTLAILQEIDQLKEKLDNAQQRLSSLEASTNQTLQTLVNHTVLSLDQLQSSTNKTLVQMQRLTNNTLGEMLGSATAALHIIDVSFNMLLVSFGVLNQSLTLAGAVYIGTISPFAGISLPKGWLFCDGSQAGRDEFSKLFSVIGTTYGTGDGVETFDLPDLRGRVVAGTGDGPGLTSRTLANKFGEESHQLSVAEMPWHNHGGSTATGGAHAHNLIWVDGLGPFRIMSSGDSFAPGNIPSFQNGGAANVFAAADATSEHFHQVKVQPLGGNQPHNNMQPSLALNFIIYVGI